MLKKNKLAREVLIQPTEVFTPDKVVNMALTQDIGVDPALSRKKKDNLFEHEISL